jgi:hypothetical protein
MNSTHGNYKEYAINDMKIYGNEFYIKSIHRIIACTNLTKKIDNMDVRIILNYYELY